MMLKTFKKIRDKQIRDKQNRDKQGLPVIMPEIFRHTKYWRQFQNFATCKHSHS